jgi:DnaA family protein
VFHLQPLSQAERLEALRSRAMARGMHLPEEVSRHLLTHCRRDLPHLLALVDGLDEYSLSRKRPLTLPLAREYLRECR